MESATEFLRQSNESLEILQTQMNIQKTMLNNIIESTPEEKQGDLIKVRAKINAMNEAAKKGDLKRVQEIVNELKEFQK